jgi:hypothetical protein
VTEAAKARRDKLSRKERGTTAIKTYEPLSKSIDGSRKSLTSNTPKPFKKAKAINQPINQFNRYFSAKERPINSTTNHQKLTQSSMIARDVKMFEGSSKRFNPNTVTKVSVTLRSSAS